MTASTTVRRMAAAAIAGTLSLGGLVAVTTAPAQAFDPSCQPTEPVLTSLQVSPTKVNVKTGDRTVVVSGTTSGPKLDSVHVMGDPRGKGKDRFAVQTNPKPNSFSVTIRIPKGAGNGRHDLWVTLGSADIQETYQTSDLVDLGMPSSFTVISRPDHQAPTLKRITFGTAKVNTTKKAAKVRVTATFAEKGSSGIGGASLVIGSSMGTVATVSLKPKKGKLVGTATITRWVGSGKQTVVSATVVDRAGNATHYPWDKRLTGKLTPRLSVTAKTDRTGPSVDSVTVTPTTGTVGDNRWQISYSAKVSDKQSGVAHVTIHLQREGDFAPHVAIGNLTKRKGVWVGKGAVDCSLLPGTYDVVVGAIDTMMNPTIVNRGSVTLSN